MHREWSVSLPSRSPPVLHSLPLLSQVSCWEECTHNEAVVALSGVDCAGRVYIVDTFFSSWCVYPSFEVTVLPPACWVTWDPVNKPPEEESTVIAEVHIMPVLRCVHFMVAAQLRSDAVGSQDSARGWAKVRLPLPPVPWLLGRTERQAVSPSQLLLGLFLPQRLEPEFNGGGSCCSVYIQWHQTVVLRLHGIFPPLNVILCDMWRWRQPNWQPFTSGANKLHNYVLP